MEQHPVPQNVTTFQFRLIGDMTVKQFGYLAGGVILAFISFKLPLPFFFTWPMTVIFALGGFGFAFVPIEERPMDIWFLSFLRSVYSPTLYTWERSEEKKIIPGTSTAMSVPKKNLLDLSQLITPHAPPTATKTQTPVTHIPKSAKPSIHSILAFLDPYFTWIDALFPANTSHAHPVQVARVAQMKKVEEAFVPTITPPVAPMQPTTKQTQSIWQSFITSIDSFISSLVPKSISSPSLPTNSSLKPNATFVSPPQPIHNQIPVASPTPQIVVPPPQPATIPIRPTDPVPRQASPVFKPSLTIPTRVFPVSTQPTPTTQLPITPKPSILETQKGPTVKIITPETAIKSGLPNLTTFPNVVTGIVKDFDNNLLPNVLVTVRDKEGVPLRALKTNKLGQFAASTQLPNGTYIIEVEDPRTIFLFDRVQFTLNSTILPPVEIVAKSKRSMDRDKLAKEIFGNMK